jgi:hypothetical protein
MTLCFSDRMAMCTGMCAIQRAAELQVQGEADTWESEEGARRPPGEKIPPPCSLY